MIDIEPRRPDGTPCSLVPSEIQSIVTMCTAGHSRSPTFGAILEKKLRHKTPTKTVTVRAFSNLFEGKGHYAPLLIAAMERNLVPDDWNYVSKCIINDEHTLTYTDLLIVMEPGHAKAFDGRNDLVVIDFMQLLGYVPKTYTPDPSSGSVSHNIFIDMCVEASDVLIDLLYPI